MQKAEWRAGTEDIFSGKQMSISVTLLLSFDKTVGYFCGGSHLVNQMFGDMIQTEVDRSLFI